MSGRSSAARDRWLNEGVTVLMTEGASGLRIDRLAARLGLSKGSFHHHFAGAHGYKIDLLHHLEDLLTSALEAAIAETATEPDAPRAFAKLIEVTMTPDEKDEDGSQVYRQQLEIALRAWALTDADVAATQARIDRARVEGLSSLWRQFSATEEEVRLRALLPYVISLGASVIMPPLGLDELRKLYESIQPLVPQTATPH